MTKDEARKLSHGVYRLWWKVGGSSLASVGTLHNGDRWFAPSNWTSNNDAGVGHSNRWRMVDRADLIIVHTD